MQNNLHWSLAPAFDVNFSYQPDGLWMANHQMTVNGKQDSFNSTDLKECARMDGLWFRYLGAVWRKITIWL